MSPSETGNLITAGAALGGAIIGGGFTLLANLGSERRQRADARNERRRDAYTDFIRALQELSRLLSRHRAEPDGEYEPSFTFSDELEPDVAGIEQARIAVLLAGPDDVASLADQVQAAAHQLLDWSSEADEEEVREHRHDYFEAERKFVAAARRALG